MNTDLFKDIPAPVKTDATKLPETNQGGSGEAPKQLDPFTSGSQSEPEDPSDEEVVQQPSELEMLKKRASLMGISYSNNIGIDALRAKIKATLDGEPKKEEPKVQVEEAAPPVETKKQKTRTLRQYMRDEKMKLVRVRITNLDPKKKDLPGEIITVANEFLGTVRKFIPFGEVTDNGYHIPQCIYDVLKERTFLSIKTRKGPRGTPIVEQQNAREFSLEVLPQLTADELAKLSAAQMAAGGL